jgi:predicted Zn-ribbon and HTH transcriptional regulator
MAEGIQFLCSNCDQTIQAWSDGNMYYFDEKGKKQHVYHPMEMYFIEKCVGNETDFLCLSCGNEFLTDIEIVKVVKCRKCQSTEIAERFELEGKSCPYCKKGHFRRDPNFSAIS